MAYENWDQKVREHFSDPISADCWDCIKQTLEIGQEVIGTVVAKAPFGAWIDVGVEVPALLLIPDVAGLTAASYQADEWCPEGTDIHATLIGFNEYNHQIVLSQKWKTIVRDG